jgi:hypothetical protein
VGVPRRSRAKGVAADVAELLRNVWSGSPAEEAAPSVSVALLRAATLQAVEGLRFISSTEGDCLYDVLWRCDIRGEPRKVVAEELNLSRRQFYRYLDAARRSVADLVQRQLSRDALSSRADPRLLDPRFNTAMGLAVSGNPVSAVRHFMPLARSLRGPEAVWGHMVLVQLYLDCGAVAEAEREQKLALDLSDSMSGSDSGTAAALALLAKMLILRKGSGPTLEIVELIERALRYIGAEDCLRSPLTAETGSLLFSNLVACKLTLGDFAEARQLHGLNPAAAESASITPSTRMHYYNAGAWLACNAVVAPSIMQSACVASYAFAARHGFFDCIVAALQQMAVVARFERRFSMARSFTRQSLELSRALGLNERIPLNLAAGIALEMGAVNSALRASRKAQKEAADGEHDLWTSYLFEAEALAEKGLHSEAQAICLQVALEGETLGKRLGSWRKRIEARIHQGRGEISAARRSVGDAIDLLGEDAPAFYRLKNLVVAERIHPLSSRRSVIRELGSTLGWTT